MLRGLDIRNMLIIDQLNLEFTSGLNVLTGETGAGKIDFVGQSGLCPRLARSCGSGASRP